jgi:uncharacterized membrane protein
MSKTIILPILAVLKLILAAFGINIPEEVINELADALVNLIAVGLVIYGIFKDHKKDKGEK